MNEDCVNDCYRHAGVDADKINRCISDSGGLEKDAPNAFLDLEIAAQQERGVVVLPTAFVNTAAIRGQLTPSSVFHAICAGYAEGTKPEICEKCGTCTDSVQCVQSGGSCPNAGASSSAGQVSTHTFGWTIFFVVAAFTGVGYWHYQKTREDMREQVRGILAEYMPLEDQDAGGDVSGNPMNFAMKGGTQPLFS
jgi:hypothetical protein